MDNNSAPIGRISMKFDIWVFWKICWENWSFITIGQKYRVLYMKRNIRFWPHLTHLFLEWILFQTKVVDKLETHILCSITFFRKSWRLWDNVEKYTRAEEATDDNMAHEQFRLGTKNYKHTLRICNTHWFSTAVIVARPRLIDTLYVHCLSCSWFLLRVKKRPADVSTNCDTPCNLQVCYTVHFLSNLSDEQLDKVLRYNMHFRIVLSCTRTGSTAMRVNWH